MSTPIITTEVSIDTAPILKSKIDGKNLTLFRVAEGQDVEYRLEIEGSELATLTNWQFSVVNGLLQDKCDTSEGILLHAINSTTETMGEDDLKALFLKLNTLEVLDTEKAHEHPLVKATLESDKKPTDVVAQAKAMQTGSILQQQKRRGIGLFRGLWMLRLLHPFFFVGKVLMFAAIPMAIMALIILFQNFEHIAGMFARVRRESDLVWFLLLGLFSNNVVAVFVRSCSIYAMGGTIDKVVMRLFLGILPRLDIWASDLQKFSRRQAIWTHAAPLISRLFLASFALLTWNSTRHLGGTIPDVSLAIAGISFISFLLTGCPLIKNHGYYIMVEFLDEPNLRERAFKSLFNVMNPRFHQNVNPSNLYAYALVSILFMFIVLTGIFLVLKSRFLHDFGTQGYVVLGVFTLLFIWRVWRQLQYTNDIYWKNFRFERWRDRTFPTKEQKKIEKKNRFNMWRIIQIIALTLIIFGLLQPYSYRPSGAITLAPQTAQQLTSDIEGVVKDVLEDSGGYLKQGTVLATLDTDDLEAQKLVNEADMHEKQLNLKFEQVKCDREKSLFERGATSEASYQRAQGECLKAEAEIQTLMARIDLLEGKIKRSQFVMPFDGRISELHLKERIGSFLKQGIPIASVVDDSVFRVDLELREVDLPLIKIGAPIEVRVYAFPNRVFEGKIESIAPAVESIEGLKLFRVSASIENVDQLLQTGMTGFAKAEGIEMKVWEILTRSLHRFFTIDIWAWLP
jgi:RND family efflux transporter MFP subunit